MFISSKNEILKRKLNINFKKKEISDFSTNTVFVQTNLDFGPLQSDLNPESDIYLDYKSVVEKLSFSINPANKSKLIYNKLNDLVFAKNKVNLNIYLDSYTYSILKKDALPIVKAKLKDFEYLDSVKIDYFAEDLINEKLTTIDMLDYFYEKKYNIYFLTKLFSFGKLGIDKKIVSTKQSITALDDLLGKIIIEKIKEFESIDGIYVYENELLYNKFIIIFLPGPFSYEQFEIWPKGSLWNSSYGYNHEYEFYNGRKKYAELQAGGYYAARYSVLKKLESINKQAKVIVFRIIDPKYFIPIGVWQVRENVKVTLNLPHHFFMNLDALKKYLSERIPLKILKDSILLNQKSIYHFSK